MGTDRLFKIGSFEEELAVSMGKQLLSHQHEKQLGFDRRAAKAVDLINAASQLFDEAGFHSEAEVLTQMLERIATGGLKKKTANSLTPEELEFYKSLPVETRMSLLEKSEFPGDWFPALRELHKKHKGWKAQPDTFKMESVFPSRPNVEAVPGADMIELETLAPEFEKEEELAPLRLLELGKKKVR